MRNIRESIKITRTLSREACEILKKQANMHGWSESMYLDILIKKYKNKKLY